jgi:hypothetical protein
MIMASSKAFFSLSPYTNGSEATDKKSGALQMRRTDLAEHCRHFWTGMNQITTQTASEKIDIGRWSERAFRKVYAKPKLIQHGHDVEHVGRTFLGCVTDYNDIVEIHSARSPNTIT